MRRWRRPATDWPNRAHTAGLARALAEKRRESRREADALWEQLIDDAPPVDRPREK